MTQTLESHAQLHSFAPTHDALGPMIVGVGATNGESVLRAARNLTPTSPRGVLAVTAVEPLPVVLYAGEMGIAPVALEDEREAAQLERLTDRVRSIADADTSWQTTVLLGDPSRAITDLAREMNSPLVIIGLGRHRPIDRLLGVETALRTVRHSPCPVLCVAHGGSAPMREVVIATDFSVRSARAAEAVIPLLAEGAVVHVLHVWERGEQSARLDDVYESALPQRFRRFAASLALPSHVELTHASREGRPAEQIIAYAARVHADLIVAGRHGRGRLASMLAGSVTSALLRGAQHSVLVTPEPAFADVDRLSRMLTGMSESSNPVEWPEQLDAFTRRNRGRATVVEEDDRRMGAHVLERGYRLLGAAYDPRDHQVELMLGGTRPDEAYVTRHIGDVDFLTVATDPQGRDLGLSVQHGRGQTLLTFS
jgi:nucleotide-binding universal stress UspA family protein